jgi:hypothetical protein
VPPRPTPFDLVFASLAEARFQPIRAALAGSGADPADRDTFLMLPEVVALIHDLRPDEGIGEGIDQLAALVQHAYLLWEAGTPTLPLSPAETQALLDARDSLPADAPSEGSEPPAAYYAQFPERRIWAQPVPNQPHEPLDGCFVHLAPGSPPALRVLGVFGLHPDRLGFTVVEASGPFPQRLARSDGSPLFAPTMPGGAAAGLRSVAGAEELLELGRRTRRLAGAARPAGHAERGRG